jgi:hypothetical protein
MTTAGASPDVRQAGQNAPFHPPPPFVTADLEPCREQLVTTGFSSDEPAASELLAPATRVLPAGPSGRGGPARRRASALRGAGRVVLDGLRFLAMVLLGILAVWALVLLFG